MREEMTPYDAARRRAASADRASRGTIVVTGADRLTWLQGLLTNDITALEPGNGCYAAWLTPQGRLITDMRVLSLADRLLLDIRAQDAAPLAERLDRLVFAEDAQIHDASASIRPLRVAGPSAAEVVGRVLADRSGGAAAAALAGLASWPEYRGATIAASAPDEGGAGEIVVVRDDEWGVPGYDILAAPGILSDIRNALATRGVARLDEASGETLRIEAGRPRFGVDMDTETIPLEAGIEDRAISFSKGCYVGQEVIVRVTTRGQGRVARRLVGLTIDGTRVPDRGEPIVAGDRDIGKVTSAAMSPAVGRPIALGYVHRDFSDPSTRVAIGGAAGEAAVVTSLPFTRA